MSRTVCSWCKAPLVLKDDILVCKNIDCDACDEKYLHEEIGRLRKAVSVSLDALQRIEQKCNKAKMTEINYGKIDGIQSISRTAIDFLIKGGRNE